MKVKKKIRHMRMWLVKKLLNDDEWKVLLGVRMGYIEAKKDTEVISFSFDLDDASHTFLHSADGVRKYDAVWGAGHELLRHCEDELAKMVDYKETYDEATQLWKCTAAIEVVRR